MHSETGARRTASGMNSIAGYERRCCDPDQLAWGQGRCMRPNCRPKVTRLRTQKRMVSEIPASEFPDKGILWRGWTEETLSFINEKQMPVLLFIADPNSPVWPF